MTDELTAQLVQLRDDLTRLQTELEQVLHGARQAVTDLRALRAEGPPGPAGPAGPQGLPGLDGRDAPPPDLAPFEARLTELERASTARLDAAVARAADAVTRLQVDAQGHVQALAALRSTHGPA